MQMKKQHLGCEIIVEVADNSQDILLEQNIMDKKKLGVGIKELNEQRE